jgi:hypothetical protein
MSNIQVQLILSEGTLPTREAIVTALTEHVDVISCDRAYPQGGSGPAGWSPQQISSDTWLLKSDGDLYSVGDLIVGYTVGTSKKEQWYQWAGLEDRFSKSLPGAEVVEHLRKKFGVGVGPSVVEKVPFGFSAV